MKLDLLNPLHSNIVICIKTIFESSKTELEIKLIAKANEIIDYTLSLEKLMKLKYSHRNLLNIAEKMFTNKAK